MTKLRATATATVAAAALALLPSFALRLSGAQEGDLQAKEVQKTGETEEWVRELSRDEMSSWLAKGLEYASDSDQPNDAVEYLTGKNEPVSQWKGGDDWGLWLTQAMEKLSPGVEVDDHKGTPIGEGETIGLVGIEVTMDKEQIALLPTEFQTGLLQSCEQKCEAWPAMLRVSHTDAAGLNLARFALTIGTKDFGAVDLHFTETLTVFPISNREQIEAFSFGVKNGNGIAVLKYPGVWAKLALNTLNVRSKWADASKKYGALGKDYYSLTPYLIGSTETVAGAMKWRMRPQKRGDNDRAPLPSFEKGKNDEETTENYKKAMRQQLVETISQEDVLYTLEIQVATAAKDQPLNEAIEEWSERTAPWVQMGTVRIPKQAFPEKVDVANVIGRGLWDGNKKPAFNTKEFLFRPGDSPHTPLGDINAFRAHLYPSYDAARQKHLLGKQGGVAAKCPFASIGKWLRRH